MGVLLGEMYYLEIFTSMENLAGGIGTALAHYLLPI